MALLRLLPVGLLLATLSVAYAERFTVNNTGDAGPGSLHHAILQANALPGHDEVVFNIPGDGLHKIDVRRIGLPEITDPITIDGYSQPGAAPNTQAVGNDAKILIGIEGAADYDGPIYGIVISGGSSVVRGLSISNMFQSDVVLKGHGGNLVEGNFLGFSPSGQPVGSGAYTGVEVLSDRNRIGGPSPSSRNVIARHATHIKIAGTENVVQGNYIGNGISRQMQAGDGLSATGVLVTGSDFLIGGLEPGAGNVISGNYRGAIIIESTANGGAIQANLMGWAADGVTILENGSSPDITTYGSGTLVGGLELGAANLFGAGYEAVRVRQANARSPAVRNTILSNVYFRPANRKIRLGGRNDLGDGDAGPNNLQNYPVITSVRRSENSTSLRGGLNSARSTSFVVQFYANNAGLHGVGRLLGTERITTDVAGMAWFDFNFPVAITAREFIAATATDEEGNTSEFSPQNPDVELANISTRGHVGTGDDALIAGFLVRHARYDTTYRKADILIRALGPSLATGDAPVAGHLANPTLEIFNRDGVSIAANDDWRTTQQQEIEATGAAPSEGSEAAIVMTLPDGDYTAVVRGSDGGTGVGIVEVFHLPSATAPSQLVNISTRGRVAAGDGALIAGIIINGDAGQRLMARAIGADLAAVGLRDALLDPVLDLRDTSGNLIASNDNWKDTQQSEVEETGLIPTNDGNSAIIATLIPGLYTAVVRGKNDTTGLAVVEFYDLRRLLAPATR